jgi:branched-chain amino acid transport system permease protein
MKWLKYPLPRQFSTTFLIGMVLILIPLLLPLIGIPAYLLRVLTYIFMWIGLAGSFNTIYGYTGRVDFGHVAFFGIGAFVVSILLLNMSIPWPLALLLCGVAAAIIAFLVGIPTLRLHGAYFAIAMWALAEALKQLFIVLEITGGSYGLVPPMILSSTQCYYLMFIVAVAMTLTNLAIEKSKIGYALRAIKASEIAAETSGIDVPKYRLIAFIISAFFPGIIGGIYALLILYAHPDDAFASLKTDQMVVMTLLGGAGSYIGPVIGATILMIIYEALWTYFSEILYLIFLGILIVVVVILMPEGILGLLKRSVKKEKSLQYINIKRFPRDPLGILKTLITKKIRKSER